MEKTSKKQEYKRPTWDEYFLEVMAAIAKRATCGRIRLGCVVAKDRQVLSTGYNGSAAGMPHCDEVGHLIKKTVHEDGHVSEHCVRTVHAEMNAMINAAKRGIALDGGTLYCGMTPCRTCAMSIINAGIKRVVCLRKYHESEESERILRDAGIQLEFIEDRVQEYPA